MSFVKIDVMAEQLNWIALDCIGVPNKVAPECIYIAKKTHILYILCLQLLGRRYTRRGLWDPQQRKPT